MLSAVALSVLALLGVWVASQALAIYRNLRTVKSIGLPYIFSPVWPLQPSWTILSPVLLPILKLLPASWSEHWLHLSSAVKIQQSGFRLNHALGTETFAVATPSMRMIWTVDAEVLRQMNAASRRDDFLKPVELMEGIAVYGPGLVAMNGQEHRFYRKTISSAMGESTNKGVWNSTLRVMTDKFKQWQQAGYLIKDIGQETAEVALAIVSEQCFDRRLESNTKVSKGHTISYSDAMRGVMRDILVILLSPKLMLDYSPIELHKRARAYFYGWRQYMLDMRDDAKRALLEDKSVIDKQNIMKALVAKELDSSSSAAGHWEVNTIRKEAVLGNAFMLLVAGHETTANTMQCAISLLAYHTESQRRLQRDLDLRLPQSGDWSYNTVYPLLQDSYTGAVMAEALRILPVLPFLFRSTTTNQPLTINSKTYMIPPETLIFTSLPAAHRNPNDWPAKDLNSSMTADEQDEVLLRFEPERWLNQDSGRFRSDLPESYQPFSEGGKSCIGRRFAQVEFCALVASIFSKFDVEPALPTSKIPARDISEAELRTLAMENARFQLTNWSFGLTLRLKDGFPIILRPRKMS